MLPHPPKKKSQLREKLDAWHGTAVRYGGVGLLFYSILVDRWKNPALFPAAVGMIFYKNVADK